MTITPWQMYWITRLDGMSSFFSVVGIIMAILSVIFGIGLLVDSDNIMGTRPYRRAWPVIVSVTLVSFMVATLIPTTKDMAAILIVPKIVNNQQVQQMPSKIMDLATEWLDALKPKAPK